MANSNIPKLTDILSIYYSRPLDNAVIKEKRDSIISFLQDDFKSPLDNPYHITQELLTSLTCCIDEAYFGGQLRNKVEEKKTIVTFDITAKTINAAGKCQKKQNEYTIQLNLGMMAKNIKAYGQLKSCGLIANSLIECIVLTMEHEILHLVAFLQLIPGIRKHNNQFKQYALNIFGHTSARHEYNTNQEELVKVKTSIEIGDFVKCTKDGEIYKVLRVNEQTLGIQNVKTGSQGRIGYGIIEKINYRGPVVTKERANVKIGDVVESEKSKERYKVIKVNPTTVIAQSIKTNTTYKITKTSVRVI